MKQETLEEAAEKFSKQFLNNGDNSEFEAQAALLGVKFGAKWQAERSYSEEEVGELVYNIIGQYGNHYGIMIDGKMLDDLFEQFKKK